MLLDTHCHPDFIQDPAERADLVRALADDGLRLVAQTMTPTGFGELEAWLEEADLPAAARPLPALGLHPWMLRPETAEADVDDLLAALPRARCLGEIGLDFTPQRLEQAGEALQTRVLRRILVAARDDGRPLVLSIHAVQSVTAVLDLLEECGIPDSDVVPVVHWFSGTSDELTRLVRLGGAISVHPRMLEVKRGRAYVRQVPADRLLLETDRPGGSGVADAVAWSAAVSGLMEQVAELRGEDARSAVVANQQRLFGEEHTDRRHSRDLDG